jgi:hypothetical protein
VTVVSTVQSKGGYRIGVIKWKPITLVAVNNGKWAGGVAEAVEYLLCKGKALSSNPRCHQKTKEKNKTTTK